MRARTMQQLTAPAITVHKQDTIHSQAGSISRKLARRNDRNKMKTRLLIAIILMTVCCSPCSAQQIVDSHLAKLTQGVKLLRQKKASRQALNQTVMDWSAAGMPKLTLMDEIRRDPGEYRGKGANKFKINQVVTYVYDRQNTGMVSKGDYFNSTELDVYYSAIEKTVKRGKTVTYSITGHAGRQEFVFISFNPKSRFIVKVNGALAEDLGDGVWHADVNNVDTDDTITFSIALDANNSNECESFVILNHNPQN